MKLDCQEKKRMSNHCDNNELAMQEASELIQTCYEHVKEENYLEAYFIFSMAKEKYPSDPIIKAFSDDILVILQDKLKNKQIIKSYKRLKYYPLMGSIFSVLLFLIISFFFLKESNLLYFNTDPNINNAELVEYYASKDFLLDKYSTVKNVKKEGFIPENNLDEQIEKLSSVNNNILENSENGANLLGSGDDGLIPVELNLKNSHTINNLSLEDENIRSDSNVDNREVVDIQSINNHDDHDTNSVKIYKNAENLYENGLYQDASDLYEQFLADEKMYAGTMYVNALYHYADIKSRLKDYRHSLKLAHKAVQLVESLLKRNENNIEYIKLWEKSKTLRDNVLINLNS